MFLSCIFVLHLVFICSWLEYILGFCYGYGYYYLPIPLYSLHSHFSPDVPLLLFVDSIFYSLPFTYDLSWNTLVCICIPCLMSSPCQTQCCETLPPSLDLSFSCRPPFDLYIGCVHHEVWTKYQVTQAILLQMKTNSSYQGWILRRKIQTSDEMKSHKWLWHNVPNIRQW